MKIKFVLEPGAYMPTRAHEIDAGLDIRCPAGRTYTCKAGDSVLIDTGVHVELPEWTVGHIAPRSGLNVYHDLITDGVIDPGYTGTVKVKLYNLGKKDYQIYGGDRIAQMLVHTILHFDCVAVDALSRTERGSAGLGSTGR